MATCTRQVTISFDGPLIRFVFDDGHRYSMFICCCEGRTAISADEQFLFVMHYNFHKSCITSVGGNASGNVVTYLSLIEDQIVSACGVAGFDADYQAVLDRAGVLGYTTPSDAQQILQNQLMIDVKASGAFTILDTFKVAANDGSRQFARLNWINPTAFESVEVNNPNWTADQGYDSNVNTGYIDESYDPGNDGINLSQNNASMGYRKFDTIQATSVRDMGVTDGAANVLGFGLTGNTAPFKCNSTATDTSAIVVGTNVYWIGRDEAVNAEVFRSGVQVITAAMASTGAPTGQNMFSCALNNNGVPFQFTIAIFSGTFAGGYLAPAEPAFSAAIDTYNAAI